jgi:sulfite reductase (ferredoxin)
MESFRTEIEDPIVQKEIVDLERKIALFKEGKIDDERFQSSFSTVFTDSAKKAFK